MILMPQTTEPPSTKKKNSNKIAGGTRLERFQSMNAAADEKHQQPIETSLLVSGDTSQTTITPGLSLDKGPHVKPHGEDLPLQAQTGQSASVNTTRIPVACRLGK
jgi:hypothetical protein